jgi:hypothetical protein
VSVSPDPQIDINLIEQARKQINRLAEEVANLSEQDLAPAEYYGEFLQRVLAAVAAPAGAVWIRTPQGNLQLQYQINIRQVGIDRSEDARSCHDELLRQAILKGQPGFFPPQSGLGRSAGDGAAAGNPTDYVILLAPIMVEKQVAGILEVWQDPSRGPQAQQGFLHFLVRMAGLASSYTRNHQLRQMSGQQQLWTQLEAFARQVHASLNPTEVAYLVANEGRRLVECDRVSVAVRRGRRTTVEAISGADVVEKRSNLVQLMRTLFDRVLQWGEKLVYSGTKDDTLPPDVLKALDEYLAESNSKMLCILPLKDERENESKKPARSAVMIECFDPNAAPEQLVARVEVVGRHATSGLYNAVEHRRIPMRFIWGPMARVQEGLGGKARAILACIGVALVILAAVLIFVPGTLKMDAKGSLLPVQRAHVFPTRAGIIRSFPPGLKPNSFVTKGKDLVQMFDPALAGEISKAQSALNRAEAMFQAAVAREKEMAGRLGAQEAATLLREKIEAISDMKYQHTVLTRLQQLNNAEPRNPGEFWLKAPLTGNILWPDDFREKFTNKPVQPNEPILRIGHATSQIRDWEVELRIPQKNIGQVLGAFADDPSKELDVDLLLLSAPTSVYKGKLARIKVSPEANPNRDDNNETEPVVIAWVRISGPDIPEDDQIPAKLLVTGTEVHAKIRCGQHALGYTLFYGVWEFLYEKVVFFF